MADLELLRESKQPQMGELIEAMVQCRFLTTIWNKKRIGILISNVIWVNLKELCRSSWLN